MKFQEDKAPRAVVFVLRVSSKFKCHIAPSKYCIAVLLENVHLCPSPVNQESPQIFGNWFT